jgi:hypothetical protein
MQTIALQNKVFNLQCGLAIVIAMCCMMENNNVATNEPMQVCDLLFGFFMLMFLNF